MSWYLLLPLLVGGVLAGWVAGLVTRRRSDRWCGADGATLTCPVCTQRPLGLLPAKLPNRGQWT